MLSSCPPVVTSLLEGYLPPLLLSLLFSLVPPAMRLLSLLQLLPAYSQAETAAIAKVREEDLPPCLSLPQEAGGGESSPPSPAHPSLPCLPVLLVPM